MEENPSATSWLEVLLQLLGIDIPEFVERMNKRLTKVGTRTEFLSFSREQDGQAHLRATGVFQLSVLVDVLEQLHQEKLEKGLGSFVSERSGY